MKKKNKQQCKYCYGKGYYSVWIGEHSSSDFYGDPIVFHNTRWENIPCRCNRRKQPECTNKGKFTLLHNGGAKAVCHCGKSELGFGVYSLEECAERFKDGGWTIDLQNNFFECPICNKPDRTTEESLAVWPVKFRQQFCRIGSNCLLNSLDDQVGDVLADEIILFIEALLKSERKKWLKSILPKPKTGMIFGNTERKVGWNECLLEIQKALND